MLKTFIVTAMLPVLALSGCHREHNPAEMSSDALEASLLDTFRDVGAVEVACRGGLELKPGATQECIAAYSERRPSRHITVTFDKNLSANTGVPYVIQVDPVSER